MQALIQEVWWALSSAFLTGSQGMPLLPYFHGPRMTSKDPVHISTFRLEGEALSSLMVFCCVLIFWPNHEPDPLIFFLLSTSDCNAGKREAENVT